MDRIEYWQGKDSRWYWRWKSINGRIVAVAPEGYSTEKKCMRVIERVRTLLSIKTILLKVEE